MPGGLFAGEFVCLAIIAGSNSDSTMIIIIAAVLSVVVLAIVVGGWLYYAHSHKQDESWKISLDELEFPEPRIVLGRGTYGQVCSSGHVAQTSLPCMRDRR